MAALSGLGRVQFRAGQLEVAERYLREAIALGRESDMPLPDLLRLYYWLGELLWWRGRFAEMLRVGEEGLALLGDDVESVEAALMYDTIALAHGDQGNQADWRKYLKRAAEFLQELPYIEELRAAYVHLVVPHYRDKDMEGALGWIEALEGHATRHQDLCALGSAQLYRGLVLKLQGDFQRGLPCYQQALELFAKIGDEKEVNNCCEMLANSYLTLGDLEMAEGYADRMLVGAETVGSDVLVPEAYILSGLTALARRYWQAAQEHFERAAHYRVFLGDPAWATQHLGWTLFAQGDRGAALQQFQDAVACPFREDLPADTVYLASALCGLDEAYQDPAAFRAYCDHLRAEHPEFESCGLTRWYLVPAEPRRDFRTLVADFGNEQDGSHRLESEIENGEWLWQDPFGDCSFALGNGLVIHAANGRHLWHLNRSAPRLLRPAPVLSPVEGEQQDWAAQTLCRPAFDDRPAIGGLLLWKGQENYLCLGTGLFGPCQIAFSGCLEDHDVIIGLGRLPLGHADPVYLRLQRVDDRVGALCSADGEAWFSVGTVAFPVAGPLQVGLCAIGYIHRHIYHGAYPDGTAIRFESFQLWGR